jgi:hypothetical protein
MTYLLDRVQQEVHATKLSDEAIITEAIKIVEEAEKRGIIIRILGASAVKIHSMDAEELYKRLRRLNSDRSFTDIDLVGYSNQRAEIRQLMEKHLSFNISRQFLLLHGKDRLLYYHPQNLYSVDIFFDGLYFSHTILFGKIGNGRLELDKPTIPVTDILLEKLQIHQINEKDIKDIIVLLRSHGLGYIEDDMINLHRLSSILGDDWGFWMDAVDNLRKTIRYAEEYYKQSIITREEWEDVVRKSSELLDFLEKCQKTEKWEKRARKGIKEKYWNDVEEVFR